MFNEEKLSAYLREIQPVSEDAADAARRRLDQLVKPLGSLGVLEELAAPEDEA